jgi:PleD family two-component response regulator
MQDPANTSWRRVSDLAQKPADSRSTSGGQSRPMRILVVDADIDSSGSLELMLHAAGYLQTRVAYSGHAALAIAAEFRPSVVLLQLGLLDMSGYEVARLLRERAQSHERTRRPRTRSRGRIRALSADARHRPRPRGSIADGRGSRATVPPGELIPPA